MMRSIISCATAAQMRQDKRSHAVADSARTPAALCGKGENIPGCEH
jgi:hypothetical protein